MPHSNDLLVTFGCSWTYGVGIDYYDGMTKKQYLNTNQKSASANTNSFRGILSKQLGFKNKNFSKGASSNTAQFRKAEMYFTSNEFKKHSYDNVYVLWGITSLARTELFSIQNNSMLDIFYHRSDSKYGKLYLKEHYDNENELRLLSNQIDHWNHYFKLLGIKNYWFDTFNHHDYPMYNNAKLDQTVYNNIKGTDWPDYKNYVENINSADIVNNEMFTMGCGKNAKQFSDSFLFFKNKPRDLLSKLCFHNSVYEFDNQYHNSEWESDTTRINGLVEKDILNPISFHPTKKGHTQIAKIILDTGIFKR